MIYVIIAVVLGFAGWQLFQFVKRARGGSCASGCNGCGSDGNCSIQHSQMPKIEGK